MALTPRLQLRQSQALVMTPQLMQAIKLLQLSSLDLVAYVDAELERNPLLERADDGEQERPAESAASEAEGASGESRSDSGSDGSDSGSDAWDGDGGEVADSGGGLDEGFSQVEEAIDRDSGADNVFADE